MNFINSIKICYTKKYAKFEGRASRSEFWYFILFYYGIIALAYLVDIYYLSIPISEFSAEPEGLSDVGFFFLFGFAIVSTLPYLGVAVRRWNDAKKSGSFAPESLILGFVPIVPFFFGLILIASKIEDFFLW